MVQLVAVERESRAQLVDRSALDRLAARCRRSVRSRRRAVRRRRLADARRSAGARVRRPASIRIRSQPSQSDGGSPPPATTTLRPSTCGPRPSRYAAPAIPTAVTPRRRHAVATSPVLDGAPRRGVGRPAGCAPSTASPRRRSGAHRRSRHRRWPSRRDHGCDVTEGARATAVARRVHPGETRSTHRTRILVPWISSPISRSPRSRICASPPPIIRVSTVASSGSPTRSRRNRGTSAGSTAPGRSRFRL